MTLIELIDADKIEKICENLLFLWFLRPLFSTNRYP